MSGLPLKATFPSIPRPLQLLIFLSFSPSSQNLLGNIKSREMCRQEWHAAMQTAHGHQAAHRWSLKTWRNVCRHSASAPRDTETLFSGWERTSRLDRRLLPFCVFQIFDLILDSWGQERSIRAKGVETMNAQKETEFRNGGPVLLQNSQTHLLRDTKGRLILSLR